VQELAKLHGGSIDVASQLGVGSTFAVRVPLGTQHLPADRLRAGRAPPSTSLGAQPYVQEALRWLPGDTEPNEPEDAIEQEIFPNSLPVFGNENERASVLLVDDNSDMREYVRRLLAPHYTERTAVDGIDALQALRAEPPSLLLSDVMMPGLDGFGLVHAVRADPAFADIPIILLSARAGDEAVPLQHL
jgi:CheY-like chemotaxis protein